MRLRARDEANRYVGWHFEGDSSKGRAMVASASERLSDPLGLESWDWWGFGKGETGDDEGEMERSMATMKR